MKRRILIAFCLLALFSLKLTAQQDFRKTKWGMTIGEVKDAESCKILSEDPARIIYECPLAGIKGKIIYTFTPENRLMRAKYYLTPEYINMNFYIRDYNMLKDLLTQKYGQPTGSSVSALEKQPATEKEWAVGLSSGQVRVETSWYSNATEILLTISKIGERPAIQVDYISKKISEEDLQKKKLEIIKDL